MHTIDEDGPAGASGVAEGASQTGHRCPVPQHAHLELKEAALAKLKPYERQRAKRFQPNDRLLEFLNAL